MVTLQFKFGASILKSTELMARFADSVQEPLLPMFLTTHILNVVLQSQMLLRSLFHSLSHSIGNRTHATRSFSGITTGQQLNNLFPTADLKMEELLLLCMAATSTPLRTTWTISTTSKTLGVPLLISTRGLEPLLPILRLQLACHLQPTLTSKQE